MSLALAGPISNCLSSQPGQGYRVQDRYRDLRTEPLALATCCLHRAELPLLEGHLLIWKASQVREPASLPPCLPACLCNSGVRTLALERNSPGLEPSSIASFQASG